MKVVKGMIFVALVLAAQSALAFNIETYCRKVGEGTGGSYTIMEQCIAQETAARARIEKSSSKKKPSSVSSSKEVNADVDNIKSLMKDIPDEAMKKSACGSPEAAESIKRKFDYLFKVYGQLHNDFPQAKPSIYHQATDQENTLCKLFQCQLGLPQEICDYGDQKYTESSKRLDEYLQSAYSRAKKRNIFIEQPASF